MRFSIAGLRAISVLLSGSCLFLAAGGVFQSRADFYFKQRQYEEAAVFAQRSLNFDRHNPESLYLLGQSSWNLWLRTQDTQALARASKGFADLTRYHPGYAKGWFYRALSEKQSLLREGTLTASQRLTINAMFDKALRLEPQSPWMMIFTALERLDLSGADGHEQLKQIRRALRQHYTNQVSPYLEEVYQRLITMGYDDSLLQQVTPKEAQSYFRLLEFYKLHRRYDAYRRVETAYEALNRKFYSRLCDQADGWLEKGAAGRAEAAYAFAVRQRPWAARARAGQLASSKNLKTGTPEILKTLESLLLQEEEELSFYWGYLSAEVQASQNPFLEGLLYFQREQYADAVTDFKKTDAGTPKAVRRFLARALLETEQFEQARTILIPILDEAQPDLRELLLLNRLADQNNPAEIQKIQEKIQSAVTRKVSSPRWWSKTGGASPLVSEGEFAGVPVNLQPGRVQIGILLKIETGGPVRLAKVQVWEDDREQFSGSIAATQDWQRNTLEFETTGGWRWLQVTLEKEALSKSQVLSNAKLRLGSVQLEYPE